MKRTIRKKYVPCTMRVLKFNVERGFAHSQEVSQACGMFANTINSKGTWEMNRKGKEGFRNNTAQYDNINAGVGGNSTNDWFDYGQK